MKPQGEEGRHGIPQQQAPSYWDLAWRVSGEGKGEFASWAPSVPRRAGAGWKTLAKARFTVGDRGRARKCKGCIQTLQCPPMHNFRVLSHPSWSVHVCKPAGIPYPAPEGRRCRGTHNSGPNCTTAPPVENEAGEGTPCPTDQVSHTCALLLFLSPVLPWQWAT